jgi:type II secretory pathway pseudopilin PulG
MTLTEVLISMGVLTITTLGILGTFLHSRKQTDFQKQKALVDTLVHGLVEQIKNRTHLEILETIGTPPANPVIPSGPNLVSPLGWTASMSALNDYLTVPTNTRPAIRGIELDTNPANNNAVPGTGLTELFLSPEPYFPPNQGNSIDPTRISPGAVPNDADGDGYGDINGDGTDDVGINIIRLDVKGTNGMDGSVNDTSDDIDIYVMVWVRNTNVADTNLADGFDPQIVQSREIRINYTWRYRGPSGERRMIGSVRAYKNQL